MKIEIKLTKEESEYNNITLINGFIDEDNSVIDIIKSLILDDSLELNINVYKEKKNGTK